MKRLQRTGARILAGTCVLAASALLAACGGGGVRTQSAAPAIRFAGVAGTAIAAAPGQTLDVALAVDDPQAFTRGIALVGDRGIGTSPVEDKPPYRFALVLPKDLKPGSYRLQAVGYGKDGEQPLATVAIRLRVDLPADALLSLAPPPATLVFEAIGEQLPVRIVANTPEGLREVTTSPSLAYQVADAGVGAVDARGMVTARGEGRSRVALLLNGANAASVAIEVLKPALVPSATSLDFGAQAVGGRSAGRALTITNNFPYPVRILSVAAAPDYPETDDCVSASPLAAGASCTIDIAFQPATTGAAPAVVSIVDSAVVAPTRVYLSGTGN